MKAAVVTAQGLALQEVPTPKPGPQQILVRLRAIGLNRADLGVAAGHAHGAQGGLGAIPAWRARARSWNAAARCRRPCSPACA